MCTINYLEKENLKKPSTTKKVKQKPAKQETVAKHKPTTDNIKYVT